MSLEAIAVVSAIASIVAIALLQMDLGAKRRRRDEDDEKRRRDRHDEDR